MAKALVTAEVVATAAAALMGAGEDPTIINVQQAVGGGSFSTVKRYLDQWKAAQQAAPTLPEPPEAVVQRAAAFGQVVWAAAVERAATQVTQARTEAAAQIAVAQTAQREAETAIATLEVVHEALGQQLTEASAARDQLQTALAAAQTAREVAVAQHAATQAELQRIREEFTAARAAQLTLAQRDGELAALRTQLAEQRTLIDRLASGERPLPATIDTTAR